MKSTKLAATLLVALSLFVTACGSASETTTDDTSAASSSEASETSEAVEAAPDDTAEPASDENTEATGDEFPEITRVEALADSDGKWTIKVTVSSPYDSPEQYADAWRVLDEDGNELGIRELAHDHASEQPFTRELEGVEIPEGVKKITVEGRDSVNGWGGQTFLYALPEGSSY